MAQPVVFVTVTDYTTLGKPTPSSGGSKADMAAASEVVIVTVTDFTTISRASNLATLASSTQKVSSASNTTPSSDKPVSSPSPTATTILSSSSATPTTTAAPVFDRPGVRNNLAAQLSLASIILIAVLYILVMLALLYARWKGRCGQCKDLEMKVRRLEDGTAPRITKETVKAREQMQQHQQQHQQQDVEQGPHHAGPDDRNRATALAALEGQHRAPGAVASPLWKYAWPAFVGKPFQKKPPVTEKSLPAPPPLRHESSIVSLSSNSSSSQDNRNSQPRYFTITPSAAALTSAPAPALLNHASASASPYDNQSLQVPAQPRGFDTSSSRYDAPTRRASRATTTFSRYMARSDDDVQVQDPTLQAVYGSAAFGNQNNANGNSNANKGKGKSKIYLRASQLDKANASTGKKAYLQSIPPPPPPPPPMPQPQPQLDRADALAHEYRDAAAEAGRKKRSQAYGGLTPPAGWFEDVELGDIPAAKAAGKGWGGWGRKYM